jgi:hypothetical protein
MRSACAAVAPPSACLRARGQSSCGTFLDVVQEQDEPSSAQAHVAESSVAAVYAPNYSTLWVAVTDEVCG